MPLAFFGRLNFARTISQNLAMIDIKTNNKEMKVSNIGNRGFESYQSSQDAEEAHRAK